MNILFTTPRLLVRQLALEDAPFILTLLNTPGWLQYIGDRQIRTLKDAREYLLNGPLASYANHGYGGWLLTLRDEGTTIGICGLFRRDYLDQPDLGFALLPAYEGKGLAGEAAAAAMVYARKQLGFERLYALVQEDNLRSIQLLTRCGFVPHSNLALEGESLPVHLFEVKL